MHERFEINYRCVALLVARFYTFFIPVVRRVDFLIFLELSLSVLVSEPPFKMAEELDQGITRAIFHAIYQPPFVFTLQWLHDVFHFEWRLPNCQRNARPACPCTSVSVPLFRNNADRTHAATRAHSRSPAWRIATQLKPILFLILEPGVVFEKIIVEIAF